MRTRKIIKLIVLAVLLGSVASFLLSACSGKPKLIEPEKKLGTDGSDLGIFHKIAEGDRGLSLRFPGYIIGIEKSRHSKLNNGGNCSFLNLSGSDVEVDALKESAFFDETANMDDGEKEAWRNYKKVKRILGDCKRMYISHVVRYQLEQEDEFPYIEENRLFSVYDKRYDLTTKNLYEAGRKSVQALAKEIKQDVENGKYSHILFFSMGWNTDQQEAVRNYNSLIGQMRKQAPVDVKFNPLFIGLTWPSEWSWPWALEAIGKPISYVVKAPDADEAGLLWGSLILRELLLPAKRANPKVPLVVLGHSFGARVMTRAVFGIPGEYDDEHEPTAEDIDLVLSIQGAFSVNRFVHSKGLEGSPYKHFSKRAKKFVLTWSKHDSANPIAAFATGGQHAGGHPGYKTSRRYADVFDQYKLHVKPKQRKNDDPPELDCNYDLIYSHTEIKKDDDALDARAQGNVWRSLEGSGHKVAMVDATDLVSFSPYNKGGGSHSDIYSPGMAVFIWDTLARIQGKEGELKQKADCWNGR